MPCSKPQLTASFRWQHPMNAKNFAHDPHHLLDESATHPMAQRCDALAALPRLAGTSPPRFSAPPERHSAAHRGRVKRRLPA